MILPGPWRTEKLLLILVIILVYGVKNTSFPCFHCTDDENKHFKPSSWHMHSDLIVTNHYFLCISPQNTMRLVQKWTFDHHNNGYQRLSILHKTCYVYWDGVGMCFLVAGHLLLWAIVLVTKVNIGRKFYRPHPFRTDVAALQECWTLKFTIKRVWVKVLMATGLVLGNHRQAPGQRKHNGNWKFGYVHVRKPSLGAFFHTSPISSCSGLSANWDQQHPY